MGERLIYINDSIKNDTQKFLHNSVSTGKYSLLTFFPRFIYEQLLTKYANLFFFATGVIQLIPDISPVSRFGTLIPLAVILIFSAVKELLEDSKRHLQDHAINNTVTRILKGNKFEEIKWHQVKVGDILRIENTEKFPCDLVLVSSSEPDAICYIETANLDGFFLLM